MQNEYKISPDPKSTSEPEPVTSEAATVAPTRTAHSPVPAKLCHRSALFRGGGRTSRAGRGKPVETSTLPLGTTTRCGFQNAPPSRETYSSSVSSRGWTCSRKRGVGLCTGISWYARHHRTSLPFYLSTLCAPHYSPTKETPPQRCWAQITQLDHAWSSSPMDCGRTTPYVERGRETGIRTPTNTRERERWIHRWNRNGN